MKSIKLIKTSFFILLSACLFIATPAAAKGIPVGTIDKINLVAELPESEEYTGNMGEPLSLGALHNEFAIAYIPIWVNEEPKLVLYSKTSENSYYDVEDDVIDAIVAEQNLNKDELLKLGFYTRYGGKLILVAVILALLFFQLSRGNKEEEEVKEEDVKDVEKVEDVAKKEEEK